MRTSLAAKSLTRARSKAAKKRGLPEKLLNYIETKRRSKAGVEEAPTRVENKRTKEVEKRFSPKKAK